MIQWLLFLFLCRFLHRYAQDGFNSSKKDWHRFICHVFFLHFWVFIQSFSFSFLSFFFPFQLSIKMIYLFVFQIYSGIPRFLGFWVTSCVIFNTFSWFYFKIDKKTHMEERKSGYNFITEKVKHVYFNSLETAWMPSCSRWLNWLQDI